MKASSLSVQGAVLCAIAGMIWGLQMAISDNHAAYPGHAHLNLFGWVSLFLFGVYYRLRPALEHDKRALIQVWLWIAGTVVQAIGVGLVQTGTASAEPLAAGGSLVVLAAMLLFAWLVFQSERSDARSRTATTPAE